LGCGAHIAGHAVRREVREHQVASGWHGVLEDLNKSSWLFRLAEEVQDGHEQDAQQLPEVDEFADLRMREDRPRLSKIPLDCP
jgi:hypothetical protein